MELRSHILDQDICALALPKSHKRLLCFLCKCKARYVCRQCNAVFYCCKEHRDKDLNMIHHAICDHLATITNRGHAMDAETRVRFHSQEIAKRNEIITITMGAARKSLYEGHKDTALYQACTAMKFAEDFSVALLEKAKIYCMLVEVKISLGKTEEAGIDLKKILWLLQDKDFESSCPSDIKADIYKADGLYNFSKQNYDAALTGFANEVLYASETFHEEHSRTAMGYFHLGQVFLRLGRDQIAYSHFLHAVKIFSTRFEEIFHRLIQKAPPLNMSRLSFSRDPEDILDAQEKIALLWYLEQIALLTQLDGDAKISVADSGRVLVALALFYYITYSYDQARSFACRVKPDPDNDPERLVLSKAKLVYTRCLQMETRKRCVSKFIKTPLIKIMVQPKDVTESTSISMSGSSRRALDASRKLVIGYEEKEVLVSKTPSDLDHTSAENESSQTAPRKKSRWHSLNPESIRKLSRNNSINPRGFSHFFDTSESIEEEEESQVKSIETSRRDSRRGTVSNTAENSKRSFSKSSLQTDN